MTRLVVHAGAQRVASDAIPRGLFANQDLLAAHGVLVPLTGRHQQSPQAVRHHLLAWSLDPDGDHPYEAGVWEQLADEVASSEAPTVLLSSELFAGFAGRDATATQLRDHLLALSDDVTLAFLAPEQLTLLNSLYCQRVRAFEVTTDFESYVAGSPDRAFGRLAEMFGRWLDDEGVRFVAMPWGNRPDDEALPELLRLCGIDVSAYELAAVDRTERDELGPVGVEATRILGSYLRGRFPDFSFGEPAARALRRRVAATAEANGWNTHDYWGWTPQSAREAVAAYGPSNDEFARRTWGGEWPLEAPVDRPRHVVPLDGFTPQDANRLHAYIVQAVEAFERLRQQEAAS